MNSGVMRYYYRVAKFLNKKAEVWTESGPEM